MNKQEWKETVLKEFRQYQAELHGTNIGNPYRILNRPCIQGLTQIESEFTFERTKDLVIKILARYFIIVRSYECIGMHYFDAIIEDQTHRIWSKLGFYNIDTNLDKYVEFQKLDREKWWNIQDCPELKEEMDRLIGLLDSIYSYILEPQTYGDI